MRGKILAAAGAVLALALLAGVVAVRRTPPKRVAAPRAAVQPVVNEISLSGKIEARNVVNIPAPTEGIVERVMADVGEDVFEGELLAQIKNTRIDAAAQNTEAAAARAQAKVSDLESALIAARLEASRSRADALRAKAEFDRAEKVYTRQKMLVQEGATPRLVFEKAEAEYNKLKADSESFGQLAATAEDRVASLTKELESARKLAAAKSQESDEAKADLGAGEVRCTVNGIVVGRHAQAGEPVHRDMKDMFQIGVDLAQLQVTALPEPTALARIKPGQAALIQVAEAPGAIIGTVREIKSGQVFIDFTSPAPGIKPGLTAQLKIRLS